MFIDKSRETPQDWDAIDRYLKNQGMTLDREVEVRQFASGVANLNYLISVDGKPAVFRRPPNNDAPPGAYDFARQYKIQSRLGKCLPATPLGLAYCDDISVIGVPFLISEFRKGIAIGRELPESLAGVENIGGKLSELIVGAMAQLHRISPAEAGLSDLGKAEGFIKRQVDGWHKRAARVMSGHQMEQVNTLHAWLAAHQPAERPATLVHLDFKLDNVLVDPQTLTVQGIVDWEMSTIGDPIYDLMLMLVVWGAPNDPPVYVRQCCMPCGAPGWWSRRQALAAYLREMGAALPEEDVKFYWLLAMFRQLVAVAQLIALYDREKMLNANTMEMPIILRSMLDHAVALTTRELDW
jgi:aminoglycoside phosphotransferase (APT) family kinase protein